MLSDCPETPEAGQLASFDSLFQEVSKNVLFLRGISLPPTLKPPYLQLASACLASCLSSSPDFYVTLIQPLYTGRDDAARSLFMAGLSVWGVMMEVDNRETRKFESVMTVSSVGAPISTCSLLGERHMSLNTFVLLYSKVAYIVTDT